MACQVKTAQGILEGQQCTSYNGKKFYSFEGVPYAKPPIGKLRFGDPQPPESWDGVRDASKPGNKCAQINPYIGGPVEGSEDCLYLNVYTPALPAEQLLKLPVMFFVHGGRFLFGYGSYYRPDYFIDQDIILVTINYRLNVLGFLCLHIPEVPGNAAMKDTIMALKWVKNNIRNFNGDENNITAFGESVGGAIVSSYLISKMADGLVHKLIMESGNCIMTGYTSDADPVEKAKALASNLGKDLTNPKDIYDFLLNSSIEDLLQAFASLEITVPIHKLSVMFLPVAEKKMKGLQRYFEENAFVTVREKRLRNIPVIIGVNSHESALFLIKDGMGEISYWNDLKMFIPTYSFIKPDSPKALQFEKILREYYFDGKDVDNSKMKEYVNFLTDGYFARDAVSLVESYAEKCKNVFFYRFGYCGNMNTRVMKGLSMEGASHSDMLPYHFYRKNKHDESTDEDKKKIKFLSEAWSSFAKNGKPTWSNQTCEWLPYSLSNKNCLDINKDINLIKNPYIESYKVWKRVLDFRCKL